MGQTEMQPFSLSALEGLAKIIGDSYSGSEITAFFRKAGFPSIQHDGSTKWKFVYNALDELQSGAHGPYQIAKVVERLCSPEEYFGNAESHRRMCEDVNEILAFYGLAVNGKTGKVVRSEKPDATLRSRESEDAKLFDARGFHSEVRKHSRLRFLEGRHFHAVFESCKAFDKAVREKARIDKHGYQLMSAALSLAGPLKLNAQQTETQRNEQEGLMHLGMGLMRAIRNPEGHEPELDWPISRDDALDILSLISFLYRQIDRVVCFDGRHEEDRP